MTNSPIFSALLAIAVLGLIVYRQLRPRQLHLRGLALIPLIVLYFIYQGLPGFHPNTRGWLELGISIVVSLVFGLLACRQLKVYASPTTGKAMARGSGTYFLWWLAAFVIKSATTVALDGSNLKAISQVEILIPVFFLVATRNAYLYWKVGKLGLQLH